MAYQVPPSNPQAPVPCAASHPSAGSWISGGAAADRHNVPFRVHPQSVTKGPFPPEHNPGRYGVLECVRVTLSEPVLGCLGPGRPLTLCPSGHPAAAPRFRSGNRLVCLSIPNREVTATSRKPVLRLFGAVLGGRITRSTPTALELGFATGSHPFPAPGHQKHAACRPPGVASDGGLFFYVGLKEHKPLGPAASATWAGCGGRWHGHTRGPRLHILLRCWGHSHGEGSRHRFPVQPQASQGGKTLCGKETADTG